jgi:hypothetical protein
VTVYTSFQISDISAEGPTGSDEMSAALDCRPVRMWKDIIMLAECEISPKHLPGRGE